MPTLLLLGLVVTLVPVWTQHQPCRNTGQGPDSGLVRLPDLGLGPHANVSCKWSHTAMSGKQILLKVDNVVFPSHDARESTLRIVLDEQVLEITRNCVSCLNQKLISAKSATIVYKSVVNLDSSSEATSKELGSFRIRYKTFDPTRCDSPKQPLNGFATVANRKVGQEVVYGCKPPYDVLGQDRAVCQVTNDTDLPVPGWSVGPPKCGINNCSATIHRNAKSGALSSPGYPLYILKSAMDCRWVIQGDPDSHIHITLTYLQLSSLGGSFGTLTFFESSGQVLRFFNETRDKKITFTSESSELTIHLVTFNLDQVDGGFFFEYRFVRGSCSEPFKPEFGQVVISGMTVGSVVLYRCQSGYILAGKARSVCQSNWTWSSTTPRCVPQLDFQVQDFPAEEPSSTVATFETTSTVPAEELSSTVVTFEETSLAIENTLAGNVSIIPPTHEPKMLKPVPKKTKVPAEKPLIKSTSKPKLSSSSSREAALPSAISEPTLLPILSPSISLDPVKEESKEHKTDGKSPISINAAEDKNLKPKNNDNTTLTKHLDNPDSSVVAPRLRNSGLRPVPHQGQGEDAEVTEEDEQAIFWGIKGYIIIGVSTALLLVLVAAVVALVVYRKKFPVRMQFGRKFSTFENPMYVSKDAQHTRELKRLTV